MRPEEIIQFILYPKFEGWLLTFKIIFLGFSLFFGGFILWALFKTSWLKRIFLQDFKEFISYQPIEIEKFKKEWNKIKERIGKGIEAENKLAILEADSLLEEVLINKGYGGKDFEAKIEQLFPDILNNLDEAREAHKLRDDIIHDPSLHLTNEKAKKTILIYEKILKALDAI